MAHSLTWNSQKTFSSVFQTLENILFLNPGKVELSGGTALKLLMVITHAMLSNKCRTKWVVLSGALPLPIKRYVEASAVPVAIRFICSVEPLLSC